MTEHEMKELVVRQRTYFETGATLPVTLRITALRKLYSAISANENAIHDALKKDLGRNQLHAKAHSAVCQRKTSPYSSVPVSFQKFSKAISLRRCTHYESMELSFSTDALTFG